MNKLGGFEYNYSVFSTSKSYNSDKVIILIREQKHETVYLQVLDPTFLVSDKQIISALFQTERAFLNKKNISRDFSTEFLVRIAGKRQISSAIESLGIGESSTDIMLIAFGQNKELVNQTFHTFLDVISENIEIDKQKNLPLLGLKDLALHYDCEENIDIIEKKALELIATIEIL
jgi:tRNA threonylcarbamoyladenosine modification (KEOPS) complex Cgi121 subunit